MGKNICSGCNQIFASPGTHAKHRVGSYGEAIYEQSGTGKSQKVAGYTPHSRRCLSVEEMLALGWTQNEHGWWMTNTFKSFSAKTSDETNVEEETDELED